MLTGEEFQKLATLLKHLHICLGLKFALMDDQAKEVFTSSRQAEFCRLVKETPGGLERCLNCDKMALREMNATQKMKKYRCHCGLIEVAMPVVENGQILASILFGQFLDDSSRERQWQRTSALLSWAPDTQALEESYAKLQQVSSAQLASLIEIIHACISEVRLPRHAVHRADERRASFEALHPSALRQPHFPERALRGNAHGQKQAF